MPSNVFCFECVWAVLCTSSRFFAVIVSIDMLSVVFSVYLVRFTYEHCAWSIQKHRSVHILLVLSLYTILAFCSFVREFHTMVGEWTSFSFKDMPTKCTGYSSHFSIFSQDFLLKSTSKRSQAEIPTMHHIQYIPKSFKALLHTLSTHQTRGLLHLLAYRNPRYTVFPFRRWSTFWAMWWWEYVDSAAAIIHLACLHGCSHSMRLFLRMVASISFEVRSDWPIAKFLRRTVSLPSMSTLPVWDCEHIDERSTYTWESSISQLLISNTQIPTSAATPRPSAIAMIRFGGLLFVPAVVGLL